MQKVMHLMSEYFSKTDSVSLLSEGVPKDVPIKAKKSVWRQTQDGNALIRTYDFKSYEHLRAFLQQLLAMQERIDHEAQVLIEGKCIKVRVTTKSLNRITEMDTEYAAEADSIFEETGVQER